MAARYTDQQPDLLPIGAVAHQFAVSVTTVRAWEKAGKLTAIRTPGGQRRFVRAEVEAFRAGMTGDAA